MWNRPSCLPGTHPAAVSPKALALWSFTLRQRSVSVKQTAKLQRRWERRRGMMQLVISWFSRWRELTKCRGESAVVVLAWYAVLLARTAWTWHAPCPASTQTTLTPSSTNQRTSNLIFNRYSEFCYVNIFSTCPNRMTWQSLFFCQHVNSQKVYCLPRLYIVCV